MNRHKSEKCYYCTHPNATTNRPSGKGKLVYSIEERLYNYYKSRILKHNESSKRKFKEFKLSLEEFTRLVKSNCYYCNSEPTEDNS